MLDVPSDYSCMVDNLRSVEVPNESEDKKTSSVVDGLVENLTGLEPNGYSMWKIVVFKVHEDSMKYLPPSNS